MQYEEHQFTISAHLESAFALFVSSTARSHLHPGARRIYEKLGKWYWPWWTICSSSEERKIKCGERAIICKKIGTTNLVQVSSKGCHSSSAMQMPQSSTFNPFSYNTSPIPIPAAPPVQEGWRCRCNETIVEVRTKSECSSRSEGCKVLYFASAPRMLGPSYRCACLNREVGIRKQCCGCERAKCKCWNRWWRDWKQYGRHLAFSNCNRICRRRECWLAFTMHKKCESTLLKYEEEQKVKTPCVSSRRIRQTRSK